MRFLWLVLLVLAALPLAGCEAIAGIFQAGMWVGALLVVLVVGLIGYIAFRMRS